MGWCMAGCMDGCMGGCMGGCMVGGVLNVVLYYLHCGGGGRRIGEARACHWEDPGLVLVR